MKLLGLDVGTKRIGVAKVDSATRIAIPETTVEVNNGAEFQEIAKIAKKYDTNWFVVGLPRNNSGEETAQSNYAREFAKQLSEKIPGAKIRFQDESLTSVEAERRLMEKTKKTGRMYQKPEVDAEAASIILQDFIESFTISSEASTERPVVEVGRNFSGEKRKEEKLKLPKSRKKIKNKGLIIGASIAGALVLTLLLCLAWYLINLGPVYGKNCNTSESEKDEKCKMIEVTIEQGDSTRTIADFLEKTGVIKNSFAFQIYANLSGKSSSLKPGRYQLSRASSVEEIINLLVEGDESTNVFRLTILPGETVKVIKGKLVSLGYTPDEVNAAFAKQYNHKALEGKGDTSEWGAEPLEGYLYGDTYEFYKTSSVENIIITCLDSFEKIVEENDLRTKFAEHGLSFYEGLTLASIVQKEAGADDRAHVAQVFYNRLANSIALGSDVTLKYALDLVDPTREIFTDNAAALTLDHRYNTRYPGNRGLTPGPISNPGLTALNAVANPVEPIEGQTSLYFLTGDDGLMYYGSTEEQHNQNILDHCQELCNVSL